MRVHIRADADARMGGGHLARSAALASALHDAGAAVVVATTAVPALVADIDPRVGHRALEARHPHPADVQGMREAIVPGDWVVLDGYHFDAGYRRALGEAGARVAVVDDLGDRGPYDVDLVINHSPAAWHLPYAGRRETRFLLGLAFALLRREFEPQERPTGARPAHRLLVSLGGSDPGNRTSVVLSSLEALTRLNLQTTVVMGAANPHGAEVGERVEALTKNGHRVNVTSGGGATMAALMRDADFAICNAGGTLWELLSTGVPCIVLPAAVDQQPNARTVAAMGLGVVLDAEADAGTIGRALAALATDAEHRTQLIRRGQSRVDGHGAARVAEAVVQPDSDWTVRPATPADGDAVWQINTDPGVRGMSFSQGSIPYDQHLSWFARKLLDPACQFWVVERDRMIGGQIRYDRQGETAVVSLALARVYRGRGLGTRLLADTFNEACAALRTTIVEGLVFDDNPGSVRAFAKAGYADVGVRDVQGRRCRVLERRVGL